MIVAMTHPTANTAVDCQNPLAVGSTMREKAMSSPMKIRRICQINPCRVSVQYGCIRFHIIAVTKPLDEVEKPLNAVRWLSRRLADNGTLFLWQPALRMGTGLSLHGLPIRIANLTALCKAAGLSMDTITTEGDVCLCARNTSQR